MTSQQLEKIVRWGIYSCALIPLIIFKEFFSPFHFGKVVVFRTLIEILLVFYVALVLKDRSFLPKPTKLFWAITIFTGVFGLTSLTGVYPYQSIMGTLERMGGWFSFLHFWAMFVMMISVLRTKEQWLTLVKISVVASLLSTVYGFLQKTTVSWVVGATGRERIFGALGNTALFAGYTLVNVFLGILLTIHTPKAERWLYGSISLINTIAVFMTVVRGSLLGIVVSLGVFGVLYLFSGTSRKSLGYGLLGVIAVIMFLEVILISSRDSTWVKQSNFFSRLANVSASGKTVQTRLWAWQAGIDGWNDNAKTMLFGWGPENFNVPFSKHFNPKFFAGIGSETLFDRAHNMFVEVLVTMGLIGIISYLGIFAVMFWMAWKLYRGPDHSRRLTGAVVFAGLIGYCIHNAFIFDTSGNFIAFFIFAGFLYFFGTHTPVAVSVAQSKALPTSLRYSVLMLLSILVLVSIYQTNILPARANYAGTRAVVASWSDDHATSVKKFQESLEYDTFLNYELRHRFTQYVLENYGKFSAKGIDPGKTLVAVAEEVKKNFSSPMDYLPYLYVSRTYIVLGKSDPASPFNDLAVENSLKALEISPTFVRSYYELAQAYLNKEDYPKAIAAFQKAAELNPDVPVSWWYLGATQLDGHDFTNGLASIRKAAELGYRLSENDLLHLVGPLLEAKRYAEVVDILGDLLKLQPNNPSYHARLAAVYAEMGRITDAVREAKRAAELDSSFEAEARAFVQKIGGTW
ncbi:MAG: O-antigen ligase family protein [Patescibacteria group bacterium]